MACTFLKLYLGHFRGVLWNISSLEITFGTVYSEQPRTTKNYTLMWKNWVFQWLLVWLEWIFKWKLEEYLSLLIDNDKNLLYSRELGFEVSTTIGLLLYNVRYILDLNIEDLCASSEPQKRSAIVNAFF